MLTLSEEQLAAIQSRIEASGAKKRVVANLETEAALELRGKLSKAGKKGAAARNGSKGMDASRLVTATQKAQVSESISVTLPWPPSVNSYWRHPQSGKLAGRHLISREGREYRAKVKETVWKEKQVIGRVAVYIDAFPPDNRRRDLDNILKSLLDSITHAALIEDDSQIDRLYIVRRNVSPPGHVVVNIHAA